MFAKVMMGKTALLHFSINNGSSTIVFFIYSASMIKNTVFLSHAILGKPSKMSDFIISQPLSIYPFNLTKWEGQ
jgi:hypothetical protein